MNCDEFSKRLDEHDFRSQLRHGDDDALRDHAVICSTCNIRLEMEESLTAGLKMLADDDRKIAAPLFLRNDLLEAFERGSKPTRVNVVAFPVRSNWTRWALAAAASIILGSVLFFARWAPLSDPNRTASKVIPAAAFEFSVELPTTVSRDTKDKTGLIPAGPDLAMSLRPSSIAHRTPQRFVQANGTRTETQIASNEVKSEFVPLTYLNDATAMDGGIVVRVEIAREQLATLGLPFDLERADDVIKADIVLGDDGVARAIRLVQ